MTFTVELYVETDILENKGYLFMGTFRNYRFPKNLVLYQIL